MEQFEQYAKRCMHVTRSVCRIRFLYGHATVRIAMMNTRVDLRLGEIEGESARLFGVEIVG